MGFYRETFLPHLVAGLMKNPISSAMRADLAPRARGRVLEVGIGSGLNLPYYGPDVEQVVAVEPSRVMRAKANRLAGELGRSLVFAGLDGANIELDNHAVDTVLTTWSLCSIPEVETALQEMRRVLKPGGQLLFIEHGLAPEGAIARWQNRLNRPWRFISGGCNINRRPDRLIEAAGFVLERLQSGFEDGPALLAYHYKGVARPR